MWLFRAWRKWKSVPSEYELDEVVRAILGDWEPGTPKSSTLGGFLRKRAAKSGRTMKEELFSIVALGSKIGDDMDRGAKIVIHYPDGSRTTFKKRVKP